VTPFPPMAQAQGTPNERRPTQPCRTLGKRHLSPNGSASATTPAAVELATTLHAHDHSRLRTQLTLEARTDLYPHTRSFAMAAAIKALNAKIRSNPYTDYFCSTRRFLPFSMSLL
jgi:hypothetical protein